MNYSELINAIEKSGAIKTRFDVVVYLVGYNAGTLSFEDLSLIQKAYEDGFLQA